jgi:chemotaxis protein CheC
MLLTEHQKYALIEFMTLALSDKSAFLLSDLMNFPVSLDVSDVCLNSLVLLSQEWSEIFDHPVVCVHQKFENSMAGDALFILDYASAIQLADLGNPNGKSLSPNLTVSGCEVLTEIGNVMLNTYLAMLSHLRGGQLCFSIPSFNIEEVSKLLNTLIASRNELRYALVLKANFTIASQSVFSYLILVTGVTSLVCLIKGIEASYEMLVPR